MRRRWASVAVGLLLVLGGQVMLSGCRGCRRPPKRRPASAREARVECEVPEDCFDDDPCTDPDCRAGRCETVPVAEGEICAAGSACGGEGKCDGRGHCRSQAGPVVDDGNPCTVDACDPKAGVTHLAVAVDDGDACTQDVCDPRTGEITHEPIDIDDGDDCTFDGCNPRTGVTHQRPNPTYACGTSCGPGYHAVSRAPSGDCGGGLRSFCTPDCGASLYTCDAACPGGYHPASRSAGDQCGDPSALVTFCKKSSEPSLTTCAPACPAGYRKVAEAATRNCGPDSTMLVTCVKQ